VSSNPTFTIGLLQAFELNWTLAREHVGFWALALFMHGVSVASWATP